MITVETFPTLSETARAMGSDATYLGGGTLVMRALNESTTATRVLRTTDPALQEIRTEGDSIQIGAGVTMAQILERRELEHLHAAARVVGGPQIRNMATVGGNLFAAHPYGDFAVALLALGTRVTPADGAGARDLEELLRDRERAGLIASVSVPRPRDPRAFGFRKVSCIKPKGVSVLSIAAYLPREGGTIRGARVVFGAMGPTPLRAPGAERALEGGRLSDQTIDRAVAAATEGLSPPTDQIASSWYREQVSGVHLRRLLQEMERM